MSQLLLCWASVCHCGPQQDSVDYILPPTLVWKHDELHPLSPLQLLDSVKAPFFTIHLLGIQFLLPGHGLKFLALLLHLKVHLPQ